MRSSVAEEALAEIVECLAGALARLLGGVDRILAQFLRALADALAGCAEAVHDLLAGGWRLLRLGAGRGCADAGVITGTAAATDTGQRSQRAEGGGVGGARGEVRGVADRAQGIRRDRRACQ